MVTSIILFASISLLCVSPTALFTLLFLLLFLVVLGVSTEPGLEGMRHGVAAPRLNAILAEFLGAKPRSLERACVIAVPWIII